MKSRLFGILAIVGVLVLQTACSSNSSSADRTTASEDGAGVERLRGADSRKVF